MASILVADDNEAVREVLTTQLHLLGHEVTSALDGEEALALADAMRFDLLVTDIEMPRMDGLLLIDRLRAARPALPILAMSASPSHGAEALRRGARAFLPKPFSLTELAACLDPSAHAPAELGPQLA